MFLICWLAIMHKRNEWEIRPYMYAKFVIINVSHFPLRGYDMILSTRTHSLIVHLWLFSIHVTSTFLLKLKYIISRGPVILFDKHALCPTWWVGAWLGTIKEGIEMKARPFKNWVWSMKSNKLVLAAMLTFGSMWSMCQWDWYLYRSHERQPYVGKRLFNL